MKENAAPRAPVDVSVGYVVHCSRCGWLDSEPFDDEQSAHRYRDSHEREHDREDGPE